MDQAGRPEPCDVLVIGADAGGPATAVMAVMGARHGLDVVVIEKEPVLGGTTAFSGGVLWIPGNRHGRANAPDDTRAAARRYPQAETGSMSHEAAVDAFLDAGPRMLDWFERGTEVAFVPTFYPDYHPTAEGAEVGRPVLAAPYDASALGPDLKRLRPPLATIHLHGVMFNSSNAGIRHFFNATKSPRSFAFVARRLAVHAGEVARHGGVQVTSGHALAARRAKSARSVGVAILTSTKALRLVVEEGRGTGAEVGDAQGRGLVQARKGVVLAAGGYAHDLARRAETYAHLRASGALHAPVPEGNTGLGEDAGAGSTPASASPPHGCRCRASPAKAAGSFRIFWTAARPA